MKKKYLLLLACCVAGFVLGSLLLFRLSGKKPSLFGEIKVVNAAGLIDCALERVQKIYEVETALEYGKQAKPLAKKEDTRSYTKIGAYDSLKKVTAQRQAYASGNLDTTWSMLLSYYDVRRDSLASKLAFRPWAKDTVIFVTAVPRMIYTEGNAKTFGNEELTLKFEHNDYFMDFIRKYPVFGFWSFVTIAQSTIWGLLILLLISSYNTFFKKIKENLSSTVGLKFWDIPVAIIIVGIFCGIFYEVIVDNWVIDDHFFLEKYNTRMLWYAVTGYAFTVFSLSLNFVFTRVIDAVSDAKVDAEKRKKVFEDVNGMFNTAFYNCALSLSLFIFWAGILVTGVNNLDTMKLYKALAGKPLIPSDYVLLIGLAHSLVLLIFFVPVHLQLKKLQGSNKADETTDTAFSLNTLLTGLGSGLGTILITASPMLTGFAQMLLELMVSK
jgi:hypothetical protein